MLTLRPLPAAARHHPDPLLRYYYERLLDEWSLAGRSLARALGPGVSRAERLLIRGRVAPEHYVSMRVRRGINRLVNPSAVPLKTSILKDKARFAIKLADAGLPGPVTVAHGLTHQIEALIGRSAEIMLKPSYSSKGRGVVRVRREGAAWQASDGETLSDAALAGRIGQTVGRGGVAQERLTTHPGLAGISPGALPTARIMTFAVGDGPPVAALEVIRMGGGDAPVDNFNHGGLIAAPDADGRLTIAYGKSPDGRLVAFAAHPRTGETIARPLPDGLLDAARAIAVEAHRRIGHGFAVIGWDVGLSDRGAMLIEGNWNPGTILPQCATGAGLSQTPAGALYRKALEAVLPYRWREAGPLQLDW